MKTQWRFSVHPIGLCCVLAATVMLPIEQLSVSLIAIVLHEASHLLCIGLCRVKRCAVEWTPFGFVAQAEGFSLLSAPKRAVIAGSGIIASAAVAVMCYLFAQNSSFMFQLYHANLALLLINALPVFPLDGGRLILALASAAGIEVIVRRILLFLSYSCAVLLSFLGLYGAACGVLNPTLLILGPYLAYAVRQSSVQSGIDIVQMMEKRLCRQKGEFCRADTWISVGQPDPLMMMHILRQCPQKKFVLYHTIDPQTGKVSECLSEQQMIVKLYGSTGNGI